MKKLILSLITVSLLFFFSCENKTAEGFKLPGKVEYKVYNVLGEQILEGNGDVVPSEDLDKGVYFVAFNDKKLKFEKK